MFPLFVPVIARELRRQYTALEHIRKGEMVRDLLQDFRGVLVSDFYAAYDRIECQQQRCLIHLMRDLNDEVLNNPFDEQMKSIVSKFWSAAERNCRGDR